MSDYTKEYKEFANMAKGFTDAINEQMNDDREKTYDFWKLLRKANVDYLNLDVTGEGTFHEFLEYNYGIKIYFDGDDNIVSKFDIVDEHQYLLFKLKYA